MSPMRSPKSYQPTDHRYAAELEAERSGWYELTSLVRSLTPDECLAPGYYRQPDWTVRDVVAHLGTWLAEAELRCGRCWRPSLFVPTRLSPSRRPRGRTHP